MSEISIPAEKVREALLRPPSGYLSNEETLSAYKDLRKSLSVLLAEPKASVEEPTEAYSMVRALWKSAPEEGHVVFIRARPASEDNGSEYSWATIDPEYSFGGMHDVEVLRPTFAPSPAEAVEADKADWHPRADCPGGDCDKPHARPVGPLANPIEDRAQRIIAQVISNQDVVGVFESGQSDAGVPEIYAEAVVRALEADGIVLVGVATPEPSPVQVEAERCTTCYPCVANCLVHGHPAPAEDDPIEALVQEAAGELRLFSARQLEALRSLAARVLEVGGQQPGVPAEAVRALAEFLRQDHPRKYVAEVANDAAQEAFREAAGDLEALLPPEAATS